MRRLIITPLSTYVIQEIEQGDGYRIEEKLLLDLSTRPQILLDKPTLMLAVFLDEQAFTGIIKMISTLKSGEDFGIIELSKLWKAMKPILNNLEIKQT